MKFTIEGKRGKKINNILGEYFIKKRLNKWYSIKNKNNYYQNHMTIINFN